MKNRRKKKRCANIINKHHKLCERSKVEKLNTKEKKNPNNLMYLIYLNLTLKQQKQQFCTKLTHEKNILAKKHIRQCTVQTIGGGKCITKQNWNKNLCVNRRFFFSSVLYTNFMLVWQYWTWFMIFFFFLKIARKKIFYAE